MLIQHNVTFYLPSQRSQLVVSFYLHLFIYNPIRSAFTMNADLRRISSLFVLGYPHIKMISWLYPIYQDDIQMITHVHKFILFIFVKKIHELVNTSITEWKNNVYSYIYEYIHCKNMFHIHAICPAEIWKHMCIYLYENQSVKQIILNDRTCVFPKEHSQRPKWHYLHFLVFGYPNQTLHTCITHSSAILS